MRVFKAADHKRSLWKNGGGETREVAAFPEGADLTAFDWRISMALVASDGPFSQFPGVERTLAVLSGGPMMLTLEDQEPLLLDEYAQPLRFPADIHADARLKGPPVTDLNIMSRRQAFKHDLRIITLMNDEISLEARPPPFILCLEGSLSLRSEEACVRLDIHDACQFALGEGSVTISGNGKAAIIEFAAQPMPSARKIPPGR